MWAEEEETGGGRKSVVERPVFVCGWVSCQLVAGFHWTSVERSVFGCGERREWIDADFWDGRGHENR